MKRIYIPKDGSDKIVQTALTIILESIYEVDFLPMSFGFRPNKDCHRELKDGSRLVYGEFKDNTYNYWYVEGSKIHIRIPWLRLNFSDPSTMRVINDDRKIQDPARIVICGNIVSF